MPIQYEYRSHLMVSVVANIQIASALVLLTVPPSRGTLGTTILAVEARGEQRARRKQQWEQEEERRRVRWGDRYSVGGCAEVR